MCQIGYSIQLNRVRRAMKKSTESQAISVVGIDLGIQVKLQQQVCSVGWIGVFSNVRLSHLKVEFNGLTT